MGGARGCDGGRTGEEPLFHLNTVGFESSSTRSGPWCCIATRVSPCSSHGSSHQSGEEKEKETKSNVSGAYRGPKRIQRHPEGGRGERGSSDGGQNDPQRFKKRKITEAKKTVAGIIVRTMRRRMMKMMKMMLQVRVPQDQLFRILVQLEGLHEVVGTRTGTACDAWGGGLQYEEVEERGSGRGRGRGLISVQ